MRRAVGGGREGGVTIQRTAQQSVASMIGQAAAAAAGCQLLCACVCVRACACVVCVASPGS